MKFIEWLRSILCKDCKKENEQLQAQLLELQNRLWKTQEELDKLKMKQYDPPEEFSVMHLTEVSALVKKEFDIDSEKHYKTDPAYQIISIADMVKWLKENKISEKNYVANVYDCENFTFETYVELKRWCPMLAVGITFVHANEYHAMLCFIDKERNLYLIEPQNDRIFKKPKNWEVEMVVL